jgi:hypothetical protein
MKVLVYMEAGERLGSDISGEPVYQNRIRNGVAADQIRDHMHHWLAPLISVDGVLEILAGDGGLDIYSSSQVNQDIQPRNWVERINTVMECLLTGVDITVHIVNDFNTTQMALHRRLGCRPAQLDQIRIHLQMIELINSYRSESR